jgi:DNA-binding transcriptional ArsR family regulator
MGKRGSGKNRGKLGDKCERGDIEYVDGDVAKAMAHPLRVQIVALLNKHVMSASLVSKEIDEPLQTVAYHFRVLREKGLIEEVSSRPVRGSTEHFYRAVKRVLFDGRAWEDLPPSLKAQVSGQAFSDFLEAVTAAMAAETFDSSDDRMAVWLQRRLDEQGWEEAVEAERELVHKMEDIYKGSRVRLAEAGEPEGGMIGTFGVFLFESPPLKLEGTDDEGEDDPAAS